jgi:glucuronate isomerase
MHEIWTLSADRYFSPGPERTTLARELYSSVEGLSIVAPHGHVNPSLLADPEATLGTPAELLIVPDHYVFRMLYSQGIPLEDLGIPTRDGTSVETDHRRIWQRFAESFHLFRGTPTGLWLTEELIRVFGVEEKLTGENAQEIYDHVEAQISKPEFSPRALFERFDIEVLCTTDSATDTLEQHHSLREEGWGGSVRPTFRPDALTNLMTPGWQQQVEELANVSGIDITGYKQFIEAFEERRSFFKEVGATATDQSAVTPRAERLPDSGAEEIFARALKDEATPEDAERFTAHMFMEMARMSTEDGLVMQMHIGSLRDHNEAVASRFGADKGADMPVQTEWTRSLHPLLDAYGNDPRFRLILFTLDESTYSRELAPLAGHYPALLLGPPWWFHDSPNGMRRYFDRVVETAGIYNLAGFNDDTRAFASIPVRHDMWRRAVCDWLAGSVLSGTIDEKDAADMAPELAYGLAKRAYKLD